MKISDRNVMRLVVVQHIRAAYGIKIKHWNKNKGHGKSTGHNSVRVFGVPLESSPQCSVAEYGVVPRFLVDACTSLMDHIHTEGLFRKSGSVVRIKALRAKLDKGEDCLSAALPCDVAGLLKQFFRELPESVFPVELQEALLKAQQLPTAEERTSATQLLSCMLPDRNVHTLRYFFSFLGDVSQRCADNKMDSSNLSVIFAPNLLHMEGTEKMSAGTQRRLQLQTAVVHFFIENAQDFGVVPQFILERIPAMVGCEAGLVSPAPDCVEEGDSDCAAKRRSRRSLGDVVNGALNKLKTNRTPTNTPQSEGRVFSSATPVILTPNAKRKLPPEPLHSYGFSAKKRRSLKKNLGLELLPNVLFGSSSTPGSGRLDSSPSVSLDSSHSASVGRSTRQSASSARRKSKRTSYRHVNRVESGKAGCFSPKVAKKDAVRKSLRLRFSLGKSSRDPNVVTHLLPTPKGSETIGWRLATQESGSSYRLAKDVTLSPKVLRSKSASKNSKHISKSEDNLLTPQTAVKSHRTSWSRASPDTVRAYSSDSLSDTPMGTCFKNSFCSEPALVTSKPPAVCATPLHLCCSSSSESLDGDLPFTRQTLLRIQSAFTESGSDLRAIVEQHSAPSGMSAELSLEEANNMTDVAFSQESSLSPESTSPQKGSGNVALGEMDDVHIDSVVLAVEPLGSPAKEEDSVVVQNADDQSSGLLDRSRLVKAHDSFKLSDSAEIQWTPYRIAPQVEELETPLLTATVTHIPLLSQEADVVGSPVDEARGPDPANSPVISEAQRLRVADHIQRFNTLTLKSPKPKTVRSPLKFLRTPVRQSVRRIHSMLEGKRPAQVTLDPPATLGSLVKSLNLDTGLSSGSENKANLAEKRACNPQDGEGSVANVGRKPKLCALDDVTNKVPQKAKGEFSLPNKTGNVSHQPSQDKPVLLHVSVKERGRQRGSPRNPITKGGLLSATKPIDL